jgi:hypothetical protein
MRVALMKNYFSGEAKLQNPYSGILKINIFK